MADHDVPTTPDEYDLPEGTEHYRWSDVHYHHGTHADRQGQCNICMVDIEANEMVCRHSSCLNSFHIDCLALWTRQQGRDHVEATCPMCRGVFEKTDFEIAIETQEAIADERDRLELAIINQQFYDLLSDLDNVIRNMVDDEMQTDATLYPTEPTPEAAAVAFRQRVIAQVEEMRDRLDDTIMAIMLSPSDEPVEQQAPSVNDDESEV